MKTICCYCDRKGRIKFGSKVPKDLLLIVKGPTAKIREVVEVAARWSYPSKPGAGDEVPLVPGIPEAKDETEAFRAFCVFRERILARVEGYRVIQLRTCSSNFDIHAICVAGTFLIRLKSETGSISEWREVDLIDFKSHDLFQTWIETRAESDDAFSFIGNDADLRDIIRQLKQIKARSLA